MQEVADLLPQSTAVWVDEQDDPFACGDMFDTSDNDAAVFYTGHMSLDQPPDFDAEKFIEELPGVLGDDFEVIPMRPLENLWDVDLRAHAHGGTRLAVTASDSGETPYVDILAISRCAQPEPPEVVSTPLPDYATVRDEALAVMNEINALLPPQTPLKSGFGSMDECDDLVDPATGEPPIRYEADIRLDGDSGFDTDAFVAQLPALLGNDYTVIPEEIEQDLPSVTLLAHRHHDASVQVMSWGSGDVTIWVDSRCASHDKDDPPKLIEKIRPDSGPHTPNRVPIVAPHLQQ